jgi:hypothetical protein
VNLLNGDVQQAAERNAERRVNRRHSG